MANYILYSGLTIPQILGQTTQIIFVTPSGLDMFTGAQILPPNLTPAQTLSYCTQIMLVNPSGIVI